MALSAVGARVERREAPLNARSFPSRRHPFSCLRATIGATEIRYFTNEQYGSPLSFLSGRNA